MTLVYGAITQDTGFLVADTFLSVKVKLKGHEGPINGNHHTLKIQILNPNTAVAFAGDAEVAFNIIRNLHNELKINPQINVPERLFELYSNLIKLEQHHDCDFLALQLTATERKLTKITKNGITYHERAHIGDEEQYVRMMGLRTSYTPPAMQIIVQADGSSALVPLITTAGEIEFAEISDALEKLTEQNVLEKFDRQSHSGSVGALCGCVIRVIDARISKALEYLQSGASSISPEEGESGFSFLASNIGVRGMAIYYKAGKMGFLFIVSDSEPCRKEYAETVSDFIHNAKTKYGLQLEGAT